jgi:penicillin-binding protein 1C
VQKLGVADFIAGLNALGLDTVRRAPEHYGLGIAVGNASVRLVNLALAYTILARAAAGDAESSTFSAPAAWLVAEMLSGEERSADAVGHVADAHLPRFAWKTGTSTDYRDAWAVAWNPEYVVAVWCGSKSGRSGGQGRVGSKAAAPLVWTILRGLYPGTATAPWFPRPAGVHERRVCALSGKPMTRHCGAAVSAFGIASVSSEALCSWHRVAASVGGVGGGNVVYPPDIGAFLKAKEAQTTAGSLRIVHPANGTVFKLLEGASGQGVAVRLEGVADGEPVWCFLDSVPVATLRAPAPWVWALVPGEHRLTLATATASASITVRVE